MKRKHALQMASFPLAAALAACATSMPENLKAPAAEALSLETRAAGVQIYTCNAAKDAPTRYEWTFKAPEADLFDAGGRKIGKHYAGPTWEALDGSKVTATVAARDDGTDAGAIPWLLLKARSASGGGVFGRTSSIQRVRTEGGIAPAGGCSQAQSGSEARVPYKATYYFYAARQVETKM